MGCPNLADLTVKRDFEALTKQVGENAAYNLWDKFEGDMNLINQRVNASSYITQNAVAPLQEVNKITDLINNFYAHKYRTPKFNELNIKQQVEHIFRRIQYVDGKWTYAGYDLTDKMKSRSVEEIKHWIDNTIVKGMATTEANLPGNLESFALKLKSGMELMDAVAKVWGDDHKFDYNTAQNLVYHMGLNNPILRIMRYNDLKNDNDLQLKKLYNPEFEGMNPMVIIHNIRGEEIDFSLIDPTSYPLGKEYYYEESHSFMKSFMEDKEFFDKGGQNVSDKPGDIRKLLLGLQIMAMKDANPKIKIRNVASIQVRENFVKPYMIHDFGLFMKNIKIMANSDSFLMTVASKGIKDIITKEQLQSADYQQSFLAQLQFALLTMSEEDGNYAKMRLKEEYDAIISDNATKHDIERVIKRMLTNYKKYFGNDKSLLEKDAYYQLLSKSLWEIQVGRPGYVNDVKDIHRMAKRLSAQYFQNSDIFQSFVFEAMVTKRKVVDEFEKFRTGRRINDEKLTKVTKELVQEYQLRYPNINVSGLVKDVGSKYFEHLFKTKQAIAMNDYKEGSYNHKKGDTVTVKDGRYVHWTLQDADTKALYDAKKISDLELKYMGMILDSVENELIEAQSHLRRINGGTDSNGKDTFTREEVFKDIQMKGYKRGVLPVISKSLNEFLMNGRFKEYINHVGDVMANYEKLFDDQKMEWTELDRIAGSLDSMLDPNRQLDQAGLREIQNEDGSVSLYVYDMSLNNGMSSNIEKISTYAILGSMRKRIFEEELVPTFNAYNALLTMTEQLGTSQKNVRDLMEQYFKRVAHRQTDDPVSIVNTALGKIDARIVSRMLITANTFLVLGYSVPTAFKSMFFNEVDQTIKGLAASVAEKEGQKHWMPTANEHYRAHGYVATHFGRALAIAQHYQVVNRNEIDLLHNIWLKRTDKNLMQAYTAQMMANATDVYAKVVGTISLMMKDDTLDAHYINKFGEVEYDEKKDRSFYDKNGNLKKEKGENVLRQSLMDRLKADHSMELNSDKLTRRYGHDDTVRFQAYSDMVIGAMDSYTKNILGHQWYWAFVTQYRMFSFTKMNQLGIFNPKRKNLILREEIAEKDENGEYIPKAVFHSSEGIFQSVNEGLKAMANMRNENMSVWWKNADVQTRFNITQSGLKLLAAMVLFFFSASVMAGSDEERKRRGWTKKNEAKFTYIYSDLLTVLMIGSIMNNPFPMWGMLQRAVTQFPGGIQALKTAGIGKTANTLGLIPEEDEKQ